MLGNDIVDLEDRDADASSFSPRWSQRVFTPSELDAVTSAGDPARERWRFWAAKEAAFKCIRQLDSRTVFSPRAFEVRLGPPRDALRSGRVEWQGEPLPLLVEEGASWLHAWVDLAGDAAGPPRRGVAVVPDRMRLGDGPSRFVRERLLRDALDGPLQGAADLAVVRRGRIPQLHSARGCESASLSLSHHGRYVAWAWRPARSRVSTRPSGSPSNESMNEVRA